MFRFLPLAALVLLLGCQPLPPLTESTVNVLAEDARGMVVLEAVERSAYQHPATVSDGRLAEILRRMRFRRESTGQELAVFDSWEVSYLAPLIGDALVRATPNTRVAFQVRTRKEDDLGEGLRLTSGRMFVAEGALHLVFGNCNAPMLSGEEPGIFVGDPTRRWPGGNFQLQLVEPQDSYGNPIPGGPTAPHWVVVPIDSRLE